MAEEGVSLEFGVFFGLLFDMDTNNSVNDGHFDR